MTLAPLLEARRLGYRLGTLMASPMDAPVYRRMGFTEIARFTRYEWKAPREKSLERVRDLR